MDNTKAYFLASNSGFVGGVEITEVPTAYLQGYSEDYPNGWWRFIYGEIGGMPIRKAILLNLLLKDDAEKAINEWLQDNF